MNQFEASSFASAGPTSAGPTSAGPTCTAARRRRGDGDGGRGGGCNNKDSSKGEEAPLMKGDVSLQTRVVVTWTLKKKVAWFSIQDRNRISRSALHTQPQLKCAHLEAKGGVVY